MHTLLAKFKAEPNANTRARLAAYIGKHMMAVCMLDAADVALLRAEGLL